MSRTSGRPPSAGSGGGLKTGTVASTATPSINADNVNYFTITALAVDITGVTVTGTPTEGQKLQVAIIATATRLVTWGAQFEASGQALPTSVPTGRTDVGFIYNAATSKWRCVGVI